jgi:hypothetical protein
MKCVVCGTTKETSIEPRFGYVICPQHANLSPVEVSRLWEQLTIKFRGDEYEND